MNNTYTDHELIGNRTGSRFLADTRDLAIAQHNGAGLNRIELAQINRAVDIFGPEHFYMDGELFADEGDQWDASAAEWRATQ
jgi:hypothetical protein